MTEQQLDDWQGFISLLKQALTEGHSEELLQLLLTPDERESLGTRVRIIQELMKGQLTQRELKEQLQTGIATITRGSNSLKSISPELKSWLSEKLLHVDK